MIDGAAPWLVGLASCPLGGLRATIDSLARSIDGRIGVAATVIETDETVSVRGAARFPMQSVYKLPIAMAVLARVDRGLLRLDQLVPVDSADIAPVHSPITELHPRGGIILTVRELLRGAIVESDGPRSL